MPESFWLEAGWSYDVRIANNYIEGPYGGILVGLMRLNEMGSGLYLNHRSATGALQTVIVCAPWSGACLLSCSSWGGCGKRLPEHGCTCNSVKLVLCQHQDSR